MSQHQWSRRAIQTGQHVRVTVPLPCFHPHQHERFEPWMVGLVDTMDGEWCVVQFATLTGELRKVGAWCHQLRQWGHRTQYPQGKLA